jgi:hypothetical protein
MKVKEKKKKRGLGLEPKQVIRGPSPEEEQREEKKTGRSRRGKKRERGGRMK